MNISILGITCLLSAGTIGHSVADSGDEIGKPFVWKGDALTLMRQVPGTDEVAGEFKEQPDKLTISRGASPFDQNLGAGTYTLRVLGPEVVSWITSRHYAIVGHLTYRNVASGSFLELENWFAPQQTGTPDLFYYSRTLGDAGPMAKIEGSDDRDFALPFDATGTKTSLTRLVLKLHAMGPGNFDISNVRLVQYPKPPAPVANTSPSQPPAPPLASLAPGSTSALLYVGYNDHGALTWNLDGTDFPSLGTLSAALHTTPGTQIEIHPDRRIPQEDLLALLKACKDGGIQGISTNGGPFVPIQELLDAVPPKSLVGFALPAAAATSVPLEWRSFGTGVLSTLLVILAFATLVKLARWLQRQRHARELRRIASLDG
jgi:hypothetical protein